MGKSIEILAPAGSVEAMYGAVMGGCDAVYIGGPRFGARAFAENPDEKELLRAVDYMHLMGKKLYLTVNTLVKERELSGLYQYLKPLYEEGLDGVIVQDFGVIRFIREYFPSLPVHASTQMNIMGKEGVRAAQMAGVSRIVLARELSFEEIREIRESTELELEAFVHGALCFCYSGQCLLSSMLGGRSGNRGRCAQPCRLPYTLMDPKENKIAAGEACLLSPKDICTLELLPDLIDSGIDSFKIEGRMKRPEYAAYTSAVYRTFADKYLQLGREGYGEYIKRHGEELQRALKNLKDLYNRGGFTSGFYTGARESRIATGRSGHYGLSVGRVVRADRQTGEMEISLSEPVHARDVLEVRRGEEALYEFTVKAGAESGKRLKARFKKGIPVEKGAPVFRTKNEELLKEIQSLYLERKKKKEIELTFMAFHNMPVSLSLTCAGTSVKVTGGEAVPAQKQPLSEEDLKRQLRKTGDTPFTVSGIALFTDPDIFIPVGQINDLRRRGTKELEQAVLKSFWRTDLRPFVSHQLPKREKETADPGCHRIFVSATTKEQIRAAVACKEVSGIYVQTAFLSGDVLAEAARTIKEAGKEIYLALPYVFRTKEKKRFLQSMKEVFPEWKGITGFVIKNYEELYWAWELKKQTGLAFELLLDYNMYVWNEPAREEFLRFGAGRFTAPVELNYAELSELPINQADLIVYGHTPLAVTEHCILAANGRCSRHSMVYRLLDRYRKCFYVLPCCEYCYNVIYNGQALCLADQRKEISRVSPCALRLDFSAESGKETERILKYFVDVFRYNKEENYLMKDVTRGHFKHTVK